MRLVGGSTAAEGRVEIYYRSSWGTVCDDTWASEESQVVCQQLGYSGNAETHAKAAFGQGTGTIWLDDVNCIGDETSLSLCTHRDWGTNDCSHAEDVGVRCQTSDGKIALKSKILKLDPNSKFSKTCIESLPGENKCSCYLGEWSL